MTEVLILTVLESRTTEPESKHLSGSGTWVYGGRRRNQRVDGFFRPVRTLADGKTNQSRVASHEESALPLPPLIAVNVPEIKAGEPGYMTC